MNIIDQAIAYYTNQKKDPKKVDELEKLKKAIGNNTSNKEIYTLFSNWMNQSRQKEHIKPINREKMTELNDFSDLVCAYFDEQGYLYEVNKQSETFMEIEFRILTEWSRANIHVSLYLNDYDILFFSMNAFTGIIPNPAYELPLMIEINSINQESSFGRFLYDDFSKEIYFEINQVISSNFDVALLDVYYKEMLKILDKYYIRIRQAAYGQMKNNKMRKMTKIITDYFNEINRTDLLREVSKKRRYEND